MNTSKDWEEWFKAKILASGLRWQEERQDYTQFSNYDLFCEQLMREAETRWRLNFRTPPSYSVLMRSMANAQYSLDKKPWDSTKTCWSKCRRWLKTKTKPLFIR